LLPGAPWMHASIGKRHCLAGESGVSRHENRGEGMHQRPGCPWTTYFDKPWRHAEALSI
jgi:hypothetical protein